MMKKLLKGFRFILIQLKTEFQLNQIFNLPKL